MAQFLKVYRTVLDDQNLSIDAKLVFSVLIDEWDHSERSSPGTSTAPTDVPVKAISAASIIAKVARDREMVAMDLVYPGYGFARHKGYPTKTHLDALGNLGVSAIHRRSFAPVRRCLS